MPLARRHAQMHARVTRRLGGHVRLTLRRECGVTGADGGQLLAAAELDGAVGAGATELSLRAPAIRGELRPGIRLTLGAETVEVADEVRAQANRLEAVPLVAPLAGGHPDGTAVAIESSRDYSYSAMRALEEEGAGDGAPLRLGEADWTLSAEGSQTTPRGDDLVVVGGRPQRVKSVETLGSVPGSPTGWVLRGARG